MVTIHHINCGTLLVPPNPTVVCHCLALCEGGETVLVDTGIGLEDVRDPVGRLGKDLVEGAGFQFNERDTAVRRLESLGIARDTVRHVVLTHGDPDHAGGLADFPRARVHLSREELENIEARGPRYVAAQFEHGPQWTSHDDRESVNWFGIAARRVDLPVSSRVLLVPLFGHTRGHCGVAIEQRGGWFLHVGDAYYLRAELNDPAHPVGYLAASRADDNQQRLRSLEHLRRIAREHGAEVAMCGFHDIGELPRQSIDWQ